MAARVNIRSDASDNRMISASHLLARSSSTVFCTSSCRSFWKWESGEEGRV